MLEEGVTFYQTHLDDSAGNHTDLPEPSYS